MIDNVGKYLFVGVKEDLDLFFARAQKEGVIEFIPSIKKTIEIPRDLQDVATAISILKKEVPQTEKLYGSERDPVELSRSIITLKTNIELMHEQKRALIHEIKKVQIFGDFSIKDLKEIERNGGKVVQFFARRISKRSEEERIPDEMIYLGSDFEVDYFISIADEKVAHRDYMEVQINESLGDLKVKLLQVEENLKEGHQQLKDLVGYMDMLKQALLDKYTAYSLKRAKETVGEVFDGLLFSTEAWIPNRYLSRVFPLLQKIGVHMEQIAVDPTDTVPTSMNNKGLTEAGEDLVKVYDVPSHEDKDPSLFVLIAFAIFFAMIVADAGYGCVYLALSLFLYFKVKKAPTALGLRMTKMAVMISSVCVLWGILTTSYFGIQIAPHNPLQKASLIQYMVKKKALYHMGQKDEVYKEWVTRDPELKNVQDPKQFVLGVKKEEGGKVSYEILDEFVDNILMEIALLVGIIHICISLCRYALRNYSSIGWILFIIGGYLYFPSMLDASTFVQFLGIMSRETATAIGQQLLYTGLGLACLLALIQHKLRGLEEPLKSIQVFADILSYLRLYALALAGMIMGSTFNDIGQNVGFVFGFFIIIFGHIVNMTLGIMGGVIHGLRLNFLEWYHYSFDGGGKLFKPLKIFKNGI